VEGEGERRGQPGAALRSGRDVYQVHREGSERKEECSVRSAVMHCRYEAAQFASPPHLHLLPFVPPLALFSPYHDMLGHASIVVESYRFQ